MNEDDSTRPEDEDDPDKQERRRLYLERLSDWSDEPMKVNRGGKVLEPDADVESTETVESN